MGHVDQWIIARMMMGLHRIPGQKSVSLHQKPPFIFFSLTTIKTGPEKYCSIKTSYTGVNNMWYLRIPQIYSHHQVTWESIEQLPFKHL